MTENAVEQSVPIHERQRVVIEAVETPDAYVIPPDLQRAKKIGLSYFVDKLIVDDGQVTLLETEERDVPSRDYHVESGELILNTVPETFRVSAKIPFIQKDRSIDTDTERSEATDD